MASHTPPPPSLHSLCTTIITTSVCKIHPSTELITQVLQSLSHHAPELSPCRTIIVCDGCKHSEKNLYRACRVDGAARERYEEYKRQLHTLAAQSHTLEILELDANHGFGYAVRAAMPLVKTPLVCVLQVGDPEWIIGPFHLRTPPPASPSPRPARGCAWVEFCHHTYAPSPTGPPPPPPFLFQHDRVFLRDVGLLKVAHIMLATPLQARGDSLGKGGGDSLGKGGSVGERSVQGGSVGEGSVQGGSLGEGSFGEGPLRGGSVRGGSVGYVLLSTRATHNYAWQMRSKLGKNGLRGEAADIERHAVSLGGGGRGGSRGGSRVRGRVGGRGEFGEEKIGAGDAGVSGDGGKGDGNCVSRGGGGGGSGGGGSGGGGGAATKEESNMMTRPRRRLLPCLVWCDPSYPRPPTPPCPCPHPVAPT